MRCGPGWSMAFEAERHKLGLQRGTRSPSNGTRLGLTWRGIVTVHRELALKQTSPGFLGGSKSALVARYVRQAAARPCLGHRLCRSLLALGHHNDDGRVFEQDEPYLEGDSYLDSETGFYDDVYGDYVFDEAEAQTSTCVVDQFTGKVLLTGAAKACLSCGPLMAFCGQRGLSTPFANVQLALYPRHGQVRPMCARGHG